MLAIHLTIQADSLALADSVSAKDRDEIESRMRQEVLETAGLSGDRLSKYRDHAPARSPKGGTGLGSRESFRCMASRTRTSVDAQLRVMEDEIRLSGDCALLQPAYRIKRVSALGGMITLKDELKLAFDLVGRKQDG